MRIAEAAPRWRKLPSETVLLETRRRDALRRTRIVTDGDTGLPLIVHQQDVNPIVEQCKLENALFDHHAARNRNVASSGMTKVASIPTVVWMDLVRRGIARDQKLLNAWLDQREARYFRTDGGRRLS
jgi:hypothetical protein